jgi:hypothetical protein
MGSTISMGIRHLQIVDRTEPNAMVIADDHFFDLVIITDNGTGVGGFTIQISKRTSIFEKHLKNVL